MIVELKEDGKHKTGASAYTIKECIGKGKFSVVYKAEQAGKQYALKKVQIFDMMSIRAREKCLKEIRLLQSMQHPNIVRYIDSFILQNELIIVLEWAEGGDLKNLIRRVRKANKIFSERQIWNYAAQMTAGLQHMHEKRVMHRDLKPANIMLTKDNRINIGDLGLSRFFTSQTFEAFSKVGTPLYMSPEVLQGDGYNFSADVWSLGCILYELCMLRSPFKPEKGVNLYALFRRIKTGKFAPIPEGGRYSAELRNLVYSLMQLDPEVRPSIDDILRVSLANLERANQRKRKRVQEQRKQKQQQKQESPTQASFEPPAEARQAQTKPRLQPDKPERRHSRPQQQPSSPIPNQSAAREPHTPPSRTRTAAPGSVGKRRRGSSANKQPSSGSQGGTVASASGSAAGESALDLSVTGRSAKTHVRPPSGSLAARKARRSKAQAVDARRRGSNSSVVPAPGAGTDVQGESAQYREQRAPERVREAKAPPSDSDGRSEAGAVVLMEDILEKLQFLDYETRFCAIAGFKPLDRALFATRDPPPQLLGSDARTAVLHALTVWLAGLAAPAPQRSNFRAAWIEADARVEPGDRADAVSDAFCSAGVPVDIDMSNLSKGYGLPLCQLLLRLVNAAVEAECRGVLAPGAKPLAYPPPPPLQDIVADDEAVWTELDGEGASSDNRGRSVGNGVKPGDGDNRAIAGMWLQRYEALCAKGALRVRRRPGELVARADAAKRHGAVLRSVAAETAGTLRRTAEVATAATTNIQRVEARMLTLVAPLQEQLAAARAADSAAARRYEERQKAVGDLSARLEAIESSLADVSLDAERRGAALSDTEPLARGRAATRGMRAEIADMEVRIGVLQAHISRTRAKAVLALREPA